VDRTFNLSPTTSTRILKFFLEHIELGLFLHFELVPDRLPGEIRELITRCPAGSLQFEIGIQTLNPDVAANVSRKNDLTKVKENFAFLRENSKVHTHADLIVGLPGETLESFAEGFDRLYAMGPDEIQVGILSA
jgi:radical SAM superfamily enzyme